MVSIKVKLQKRPGHRGKYESVVVTLPKDILDAAPSFKTAKEAELDVQGKKIVLKVVKK